MVQLKPSMKREMRGCAVEVKRACWLAGGGCTWSKENTCFFGAEAEETTEAAAVVPDADGALVEASTETDVEEVA
jgi:hypothetical protein